MDIKRWMTSPWRLLIFLPIFQFVSSCPTQCICTGLPRNKLLSNLLLSNAPWNITELELVSCTHQSLLHLPNDLPAETIILDLSYNNLAKTGNIHPNLTNVRTILYSYNNIQLLENEEFYKLHSLKELFFTHNSISIIEPYTFQNSSSLKKLDLSRNQLVSVDSDTFVGLTHLTDLNLRNNRLQNVSPGSFIALKHLEILDLSFNSLKQLHLHMFEGLENITVLNLSHNHINYISTQTFQSLVNLKELDLSHNVLGSTSHFLFSGLIALSNLDLSNNLLKTMSVHTFNNATNIRTLDLDNNPIPQFNIPVFRPLHNLENLTLSQLPYLTSLAYNAFTGLNSLKNLNLSFNFKLSAINPHLFSPLPKLQHVDLHSNNISHLSALTFHHNLNLSQVDLSNNPFLCDCDIAWLAKIIQENSSVYGNDTLTCAINDVDSIPISQVTNETFPCAKVETTNTSETSKLYFRVGATAHIDCNISLDSTMIMIWTTPRKKVLTYHAIYPEAIEHHPDLDHMYQDREWVNSTSYHSEMINRDDRVTILSDGSIFIDYVLRSDTGPYTCQVGNAYNKVSRTTNLWLDYSYLYVIKKWSLIIGVCCAASFFVLIVVYTLIRQCTIRVINKRRRDAIRKVLENMDMYKHNQITRIRDNYNTQLTRVSDHYHNQLESLRGNYSMQMGRVKRGCSHQVDRIRDNYSTQCGRLKDYSSTQIEQLRSGYSNQLLKIRDYGSLTFDRLRETCKLQQKNVLKILETMNIENCKTVIETECMRTESMIFEPEFDDDIQGLSLIGSESDYITASETEDTKSNESDTPEVDLGLPTDDFSLEIEDVFEPLVFSENDLFSDQDDLPLPDLDLSDISLKIITERK